MAPHSTKEASPMHNYLDRIKYTGSLEPTKQVLFELHKQHLLSVPFENLDIHSNRKIVLDLDLISHKIIDQLRGGFCYELNSLFNSLLVEIGFKTKLVSARVFGSNQEYGPEFDHMAIIVNISGLSYLADVGFGKFIMEPLKIDFNEPQSDSLGRFQFIRMDKDQIRVELLDGKKIHPQYIFRLLERDLSEFESMCHYHQHSPESHFPKKKVISKCTERGRITLSDTELKITEDGKTTEQKFEESEFGFYLDKYFGIIIQ